MKVKGEEGGIVGREEGEEGERGGKGIMSL